MTLPYTPAGKYGLSPAHRRADEVKEDTSILEVSVLHCGLEEVRQGLAHPMGRHYGPDQD